MHPFDWKVLDSTYALKDRWIAVRSDVVQMPSGKVLEPFYALDYPDYVHVVGVTTDQQVILVRQYRHGAGATLLELPSGVKSPEDATPLDTAKREMLEETGFSAKKWLQLPTLSPNPATHANTAYNFLALDMQQVSEQSLDESEQIEIVLMPLEDVRAVLLRGGFLSALHTSALFFAFDALSRLPE